MRAHGSSVALCLVVAMAGAVAPSHAAERPHVKGTLKGFFLTSAGQLHVRSLDVCGPPHRPSGPALYPLWSSYYFHASVISPEPLARVRIVASADNTVLYDEQLKTPVTSVDLPTTGGQFIGAHVRHGLAFRFELTSASGRVTVVPAGIAGAQLLPVPELKIDWLDLIRIAEVRRMLREKGDAILPGLRADDVPFALKGDDDQLVLIDHPKPPPGFHRYTGPLPIAVGRVVVGQHGAIDSSPLAQVTGIGGTDTVLIEYPPEWGRLPDANCPGLSSWDAPGRITALVHETCHVNWHRRGRTDPAHTLEGTPAVPPLEVRANQVAELLTLARALGLAGPDRRRAILAYLALRDRRAALSRAEAAVVSDLDRQETDEGLAYYAGWKAAEVLGPLAADSIALRTDPFHDKLYAFDLVTSYSNVIGDPGLPLLFNVYHRLSFFPSLAGSAQAHLLADGNAALLADVWTRGASLFAALVKAVGYDQLTADQKLALQHDAWKRRGGPETLQALGAQVRQGEHALRAALAEARAGRGLSVHVRGGPYNDTANRAPFGAGQWLASYVGFGMDVERPCIVRDVFDRPHGAADATLALSPNDGPLVACRIGDSLSVRAPGMKLDLPRVAVRRRADGLHVDSSGSMASAFHQPRDGEMVGSGSYVLPLEQLAAADPVRAQLPTQTLAYVASGNFLNNSTGQLENRTLDFFAEQISPTGNWAMVEGQTYAATATASDTGEGNIAQVVLTNDAGEAVMTAVSDLGARTLSATGRFEVAFAPALVGRVEVQTKREPRTGRAILTFTARGAGPPGALNVNVYATGPKAVAGLPNARVDVWVDGHKEATLHSGLTDNAGRATLGGLGNSRYWVMDVSAPSLGGVSYCHVQYKRVWVSPGAPTTDSVYLSPHSNACLTGTFGFIDRDLMSVRGKPDEVALALLQNGKPVAGVGPAVVTKSPTGGTYTYTISGPSPLAAGTYAVQATLAGWPPQQADLVVPDDCAGQSGREDFVALTHFAHGTVTGPCFVFRAKQ